jgi:ABC-type Fe3+-hydroxamate transport system substrate-binding protein
MAFDLGFGDHVVGVDQYSRLPPGVERPVVGSAVTVRVEPILAVKPDLLLVNMDPRQFEPVVRVAPEVRIEHFDLFLLEDIAAAAERMARLVGKSEVGKEAARSFRDALSGVRNSVAGLPRPPVLFVLGFRNPLGPGSGDFIDEMITLAGGQNVLSSRHSGWKKVTLEEVVALDPQLIICQSDEAERADARRYWGSIEVPEGSPRRRIVVLTDSRWTLPALHLADCAEELAVMIHPEVGTAEGKP